MFYKDTHGCFTHDFQRGGGVAPGEALLPPWVAALRSTLMKDNGSDFRYPIARNGSDVRYAIALALALLTVLSMVAIASASPSEADGTAMSGECGTGMTWELTENTAAAGTYTLTISGTGAMEDYHHTDLGFSDGKTDVEPPWGDYKYDITDIVLQDGITHIGSYAFYGTGITSIYIPDTVETIGASAFWFCTSLESVEIPASITVIETSTFSRCDNLSEIYFEDPTAITSIGNTAFQSTNLNTADFSKFTSLKTIGAGAFSYTEIVSIELSPGIESIGFEAFNGCSSLKSLGVPEGSSLKTIDERAFNNTALESVDLSNATQLSTLGNNAFGSCRALTTVTLPDSIDYSEESFSGSPVTFSLDFDYDDMSYYLSEGDNTVTVIPKGTMGANVELNVDNDNVASVSGSTLTVKATGTATVTATATYEGKTYTDSFVLTVVQSPVVEGLTFLPMTDSMETTIDQVEVPNVPMTDFVESTLVNIEPSEGSEIGAIPYDVLGWSIDSSNFDDYVYYAVHYNGTGIYTPEVVSVTATSQGLVVGFNGFSPYVFGYTVKAVEPGPTPGYDDDEDLPPFIPTQPKDSGDDVTIVACAAAAVVAALMAVFLIVSYKKD